MYNLDHKVVSPQIQNKDNGEHGGPGRANKWRLDKADLERMRCLL